MTLLELKVGAVGEVFAFQGGKAFVERLNGFGIYIGRKIKLIKAAPFRGPLLVEDVESGARIMIGRGMAGKIEVTNGSEPVC